MTGCTLRSFLLWGTLALLRYLCLLDLNLCFYLFIKIQSIVDKASLVSYELPSSIHPVVRLKALTLICGGGEPQISESIRPKISLSEYLKGGGICNTSCIMLHSPLNSLCKYGPRLNTTGFLFLFCFFHFVFICFFVPPPHMWRMLRIFSYQKPSSLPNL